MTFRNVFICVRLFAGFFITLLGLSMLVKSDNDEQRFLGSIFAAIGLTFFYLLRQAKDQKTL
jgi:hypothetical protein